jgi:nitric oxide reductase subunit C
MLVAFNVLYSSLVYTIGTDNNKGEYLFNENAKKGQLLYQKYNCTACHQLYGLGGYMGPDLTNVMSKGEPYTKVFLQYGTQRMPNFHLSDEELSSIIAFLNYTDKTGTSPIKHFDINRDGTITPK